MRAQNYLLLMDVIKVFRRCNNNSTKHDLRTFKIVKKPKGAKVLKLDSVS